jgi:hypothetical protein
LFRVHQDRGSENRWFPIETAPRDEQAFLVLVHGSGTPVVAVRDPDGAWRNAWSGERILDPTHWGPIIPPLPDED